TWPLALLSGALHREACRNGGTGHTSRLQFAATRRRSPQSSVFDDRQVQLPLFDSDPALTSRLHLRRRRHLRALSLRRPADLQYPDVAVREGGYESIRVSACSYSSPGISTQTIKPISLSLETYHIFITGMRDRRLMMSFGIMRPKLIAKMIVTAVTPSVTV